MYDLNDNTKSINPKKMEDVRCKREHIHYNLSNDIGFKLFLSYDFLKVLEFGIDFLIAWKTVSPNT